MLSHPCFCEFQAEQALASVTIVLDPDGVVADAAIFAEIAARGYTALRNSPAYFPFSMTDIGLEQFLASFSDMKCDHYLGSDELVSIMRQSTLGMK